MGKKVSIGDCGIYCISVHRGDKPEKHYIGQSVRLKEREQAHFWMLRNRRHKNPLLQSAFDNYGVESIKFKVILNCDRLKDVLESYEQAILDAYIAEYGEDRIYNVRRLCVSSALGTLRSDESRARMSLAQGGRKLSPEQIEILRRANTGRKLSPEAIAIRTEKQRGRIVSPETRAKHAEAIRGIKRSAETRERISAGKKGQGPSVEHMERLRQLATGRQMPDHVKQILVTSNTGKKKSPEEIARRQATRAANKAAKLAEAQLE